MSLMIRQLVDVMTKSVSANNHARNSRTTQMLQRDQPRIQIRRRAGTVLQRIGPPIGMIGRETNVDNPRSMPLRWVHDHMPSNTQKGYAFWNSFTDKRVLRHTPAGMTNRLIGAEKRYTTRGSWVADTSRTTPDDGVWG